MATTRRCRGHRALRPVQLTRLSSIAILSWWYAPGGARSAGGREREREREEGREGERVRERAAHVPARLYARVAEKAQGE